MSVNPSSESEPTAVSPFCPQDLLALQHQVAKLAARVDTLESVEAIRALRNRYHELVNEDAGHRLYELFAPDAVVAYGGRAEVQGRDNIRAFFAAFPVQAAGAFGTVRASMWWAALTTSTSGWTGSGSFSASR